MVCLGDKEDKKCKGLIRLLSVLLSTEKGTAEKKEILEREFNIAMTKTMEAEADEMCDFSKYVEEKAMKKGIQKGMQKGIEQAIKNLIKNANMTLEQAMTVLEVSENDRVMYAGRIEKGH